VTLFAGHDLACRRGERLVFTGLSFRVAAGSALLLRGPNGSGKSSLLRCMAGLLAPVAGTQTWNDRPIALDADAHRGRLRYLGHQDAVKPALTVLENLVFWQQLHGRHDVAAVGRGLAGLGLDRLAELPARLLSAGQRRRVALARLLASPAPLWLLDEPTTNLDTAGQRLVGTLIEEHLARGGLAVAAIHHELAVSQAVVRRLELSSK